MFSDLIPAYDPQLFSEIHQVSTFLPREENVDSLWFICYVMGAITVMFGASLQCTKLWMGTGKGGSAEERKASSLAAWKASYQMTNLLVNLALGCMGLYYQASMPWGESIANKIVGYEHLKLFSCGQIGYQLWALPVGFFFVGETTSMLMHHAAVICVCSVSAFIHAGFRFYTPYFYGLIEISSVPLSVVNAFKNNKHWIKQYPEVYTAVRLVFAISFLVVRVVLWTPYYWSFWVLETMFLWSSDSLGATIILALFNVASLFLTFLQYFWATKIISAIVNLGGGAKKKVT